MLQYIEKIIGNKHSDKYQVISPLLGGELKGWITIIAKYDSEPVYRA